jgi:hypothetical protein
MEGKGGEALEPISQPTRKTRFFHSKLQSEHLRPKWSKTNLNGGTSSISSIMYNKLFFFELTKNLLICVNKNHFNYQLRPAAMPFYDQNQQVNNL